MAASVRLEGVGVQFVLDRQRRPLTPALARLRRTGSASWGVQDVNLELEPGESLALLGPSGSGKTTLLRAIAGVLPADAGRLSVNGRIGCLLSTEAGLLPTLTARDNALLLSVLAGLSRTEARRRLGQVKERSGLGSAFERNAASLSAGMKARLGVAAARQADAEVLLLDEVHEALDQDYRGELARYAESLRARGGIVIAAGQDLGLLGTICTRGVLMRAGSVAADGSFDGVKDKYLDDE
jgi:ABC-type polysaccharide/polyol phosphate transport system ATPase subunit